MFYKATVLDKIGENPTLQLAIAGALGIGQKAVQVAVQDKRKSLAHYAAAKVISDHLSIPVDELFEQTAPIAMQ